jgi:thioesterase domain-containing protein
VSAPAQTAPSSDQTGRDALRLPYDYLAPANPQERLVAQVFADVLRVFPVGVEDDFYDLGGDSLTGEQISLEIQHRTGQDFAISTLFDCPTPRLIADFLRQGALPLSPRNAPIFVVHGRGGYTVPRPEFHQGLARGSRLVMFELPGIRGNAPYLRTLPEIAAAYVAQIGRDYPRGPVHLAAFCAGGLIALEMAAQLRAAGRPLAGLVLLDPSVPDRVRLRHRLLQRLQAAPNNTAAQRKYAMLQGGGGTHGLLHSLEWRLRLWSCILRENWLDRLRHKGSFWKHRHAGLKVLPRAALIVAYRFGWPAPYDGPVGLIASEDRAAEFADPASIWGRLIPQRQMAILARHHDDIGQANAAEVAARMEAMLLDGVS